MPDIRVEIVDTDAGANVQLDIGEYSRQLTPERAEMLAQALIRRSHKAREIDRRLRRHLRAS